MKTINESELNKLCEKIEKLTDRNAHTEAKIIVCKVFGYFELAILLLEINRLHNSNGWLTVELGYMRTKIHKIMLEKIRAEYGEEVYKRIRNAY